MNARRTILLIVLLLLVLGQGSGVAQGQKNAAMSWPQVDICRLYPRLFRVTVSNVGDLAAPIGYTPSWVTFDPPMNTWTVTRNLGVIPVGGKVQFRVQFPAGVYGGVLWFYHGQQSVLGTNWYFSLGAQLAGVRCG